MLNYESILKACDWAVANSIDYLMTPEASVSGYDAPSFTVNTCQDTEDAVKKLHTIFDLDWDGNKTPQNYKEKKN